MADPALPQLDYVSTGVPGLDSILGGGFLRGGLYLLQGGPGSGKTTLALQTLFHRENQGERGIYVSLTESARDLQRTCLSHGWDWNGIRYCDLTRWSQDPKEVQSLFFHPSEVELGETVQRIMEEIKRTDPRYIVLDGLSEIRLLAGDPLRYRRQMMSLKYFFEEAGHTVLILDDQSHTGGENLPESLVGGNIVMERSLPGYGGARRRINVTKVRGSDFRDGFHDYKITTGGLLIHPRLIAAEHRFSPTREPFPSGIAEMDQMLGGGLETGTTTLMLGPSGVGKSTVAMQ
ncbi:MAG: AAA family ATPase, partial [Armatimonadetes bacterium]|nr:AAA family ATPase [Armatimonadota bacterium]